MNFEDFKKWFERNLLGLPEENVIDYDEWFSEPFNLSDYK